MSTETTDIHPSIQLAIQRDVIAGKQQRIDKLEAWLRAAIRTASAHDCRQPDWVYDAREYLDAIGSGEYRT